MPKRTAVGNPGDFAAGKMTVVEIDGREFYVTRLPSGEFRAFRNACPHKGAPLLEGVICGAWPPSEPGVRHTAFRNPADVTRS